MKMLRTTALSPLSPLTPLYASWSSGIYTCGRSSFDLSADTDSYVPDFIIPDCRAQKERSPKEEQSTAEDFAISRHNPMKTFKRESVIASWKSLKKEREQALGKKYVTVPNSPSQDYYGRRKVKRTKSERTTLTDTPRKKVKRNLSIMYRYDADEEKVVKEYKFLRSSLKKRPFDKAEENTNKILLKRSFSEPSLLMVTHKEKPRNKIKRSLTTLLNLKSKFLNIFSSKS